MRIFKGLFSKSLLKQSLERSSNFLRQYKKARQCRAFLHALSVGASAPNPDTRNFSRKVSCESSKASPKIKWCVRWEILLHTFLIRKVCSLAHLSPKERCVYNIFCIKTHLQAKLIIVTFLLTAKSEYISRRKKHFF